MKLAIAIALAACGVQDVGGGAGLDLTFLDQLGLPVGEVFQCQVDSDPLQEFELCWKDSDSMELADAVSEQLGGYATECWATQRHAGPCLYSCQPDHTGCNALSGCWCP